MLDSLDPHGEKWSPGAGLGALGLGAGKAASSSGIRTAFPNRGTLSAMLSFLAGPGQCQLVTPCFLQISKTPAFSITEHALFLGLCSNALESIDSTFRKSPHLQIPSLFE